MDDEIATIEKNNTWELVDQPEKKEVIVLNGSIRPSTNKMVQFKSTRHD